MNPQSVLKRRQGFTVRTLGDETLFLNPTGAAIHVADEVGGFIYRQIDGNRTIADILAAILNDFDVDAVIAKADLDDFITEMVKQDILEVTV